jgi:YD repeat-containing protein
LITFKSRKFLLSCFFLLSAFRAEAGVDPASGNYSTEFNDVKVVGGLTIRLDRIYNSLNGADGYFGTSWSSNLEAKIKELKGGSIRLRESPSGEWVSVKRERLTKQSDLIILSDGIEGSRMFDRQGDLVGWKDDAGNWAKISYGTSQGKRVPTLIRDNLNRRIEISFGNDGHISEFGLVNRKSAKFLYDQHGLLIESTDAASHRYRYSYVKNDRPLLTKIMRGETVETELAYDENEPHWIKQVKEEGHPAVEYKFNHQGRSNQITGFRSQVTSSIPGKTGAGISVEYRAHGETETTTLGTHSTELSPTSGALVSESWKFNDGQKLNLKYGYNSAGKITFRESEYDSTKAEYDAKTGKISLVVWHSKEKPGRQARFEFGYDAKGELISAKSTTPSEFKSLKVLYDSMGRIKFIADAKKSSRNERLTYDEFSRLKNSGSSLLAELQSIVQSAQNATGG